MNNCTQGARRILISGAGIAGLTLAWWLERAGMRPVLVERAAGLRAEGYGIDFCGTGWDVAERMGLLAELRQRQNAVRHMIFKDGRGHTLARMPIDVLHRALDGRMIHIMRQSLEEVLHAAVRDRVEIRFGSTIRQVEQLPDHARVTFADGSAEAFDLVVGADGIRSQVRGLVFGDERRFAEYLGYYVAAFPAPNLDGFGQDFVNLQEPGRQAGVYPSGDGGYTAVLVYRAPDSGAIPPAQRKALLAARYRGAGWVVPRLIDSIGGQTPVYLDTVTQIRTPRWSEGRVVLVGDAAHCLTLISGQGASMAMGGAYFLAEELGRTGDHTAAFAAYERRLRPAVEDRQRRARGVARVFVPRSRLGIRASQLGMRLLFTPLLARFAGRELGISSLLRPA